MSTSVQIVTGGAGFIGSNLVNALIKRGHEVVVMDNLVRGKIVHLNGALQSGKCSLMKIDCSDFDLFYSVMSDEIAGRNPGSIWHLAANSEIAAGISDPRIDLYNTFMTTFNALRILKEFKIPHFNFASSSAIYGDLGDMEICEGSGPCRPISNYGAMKLASESLINAAYEDYSGKACVFRFPNVVGSPATHGVIHDLMKMLKTDPSRLPVLGNGFQQKPYMHINDLIAAMLFIADNAKEKVNIYNIGQQDSGVSVRFIAESVRDAVSPSANILYGESDRGWVGDIPRFRYSTTKLETLGWKPSLTSKQAVELAIRDIENSNYDNKLSTARCTS